MSIVLQHQRLSSAVPPCVQFFSRPQKQHGRLQKVKIKKAQHCLTMARSEMASCISNAPIIAKSKCLEAPGLLRSQMRLRFPHGPMFCSPFSAKPGRDSSSVPRLLHPSQIAMLRMYTPIHLRTDQSKKENNVLSRVAYRLRFVPIFWWTRALLSG